MISIVLRKKSAGWLSIFLLINFLVMELVQAQQGVDESMAEVGVYQTAIFAGGCFWCVESDFDKVKGVIDTLSGYSGGHIKNPTYQQVSAGVGGHVEVVKITFDPAQVSYKELLVIFWHSIDPTVLNRQFCDRGRQYRSVIYYRGEGQKRLAEQSRQELEESKPFGDAIVTEIVAASTFYRAEEYHQDYHQKNPLRYKYYRYSCGRDERLKQLWGEPA